MFVTALGAAMAIFAFATRYVAKRQGVADGIIHRPTGNPYNDAAGARKLPVRARIQASWTRYARYYR